MLDTSAIDDLVEDFMADGTLKTNTDVAVLRDRYVAIFCLLQRELRSYKQRVATLLKQLEEKQELNASFRKDIESLHGALTSMQLADKVYDLVSTDLQQLVTSTAADTKTVNQLSYAADNT
jgi:conjugal transfer/entry exclusion protein